ncbi:MAG: 50S ribosomal protein L30 [Fibrobacteres bacterium]|nr:50S ribosomal protein L30 [Fibrobacterota bacterium]
MNKKLIITQVRGLSGMTQRQIESVKTLGLKRIRHSVTLNDTPALRGKIKTVGHLVSVKEA